MGLISAFGARGLGSLVALSTTSMARYPSQPLQLEARQQIYEEVTDYPGLHLSAIARSVEMETNHAKYHLRVLETNDYVSSQRQDGYWRFYPRKEGKVGKQEILQPREKQWLALLRRSIPLQATLTLLGRGSMSAGDLADRLDIAPSTMHYHATKMEEAGLLESRKVARERMYELADPERVGELIARHEPPDALVEGFMEGWDELQFP